MAATTTATPTSWLTKIQAVYEIVDPERVLGQLSDQPEIASLLIEASEVVPRYFSESSRLVLELVPDREDDDREDLFAIVRTPLSNGEALERLDRLDAEWWLDQVDRASGRLTIDVEPV